MGVLCPFGYDEEAIDTSVGWSPHSIPLLIAYRAVALIPQLPPRLPESHKGDFGRVLVVGGSRGMSGAAALAGRAALRGGAGLVTIATADDCVDIVASLEPSYMTLPLPSASGCLSSQAKGPLQGAADQATVIACGPGLGRTEGVVEIVRWLYESVQKPMVLDADALNALSLDTAILDSAGGPRILTPHLGEFRRLVGLPDLTMDEAQRIVVEVARDKGIVVVLKGHRTLVSNGAETSYNATGNPGMATGGCGDVLTGLTAALLAQHMEPYSAARLAVHLHGLAGDLAANELGQVSLIAADLVEYLPPAFMISAGKQPDEGH